MKNTGLFSIICLIFQLVSAKAQTNISSSYLDMLSNAEVNAQVALSNQQAKAEYYRLHPTNEQLEMMSNAMVHWKPAQPWPEASGKQETLKHCAEVLWSAIDINQVEMSCNKMTNRPEAALALKNLTKEAISNLYQFAALLTNSALTTSLGEAGYEAGIFSPTNLFHFDFWSKDRLPTLIRDFDERTPDAQHILVNIRFYENGKVMFFTVYSPERWGLGFNEDGSVRNYYAHGQNIWLP